MLRTVGNRRRLGKVGKRASGRTNGVLGSLLGLSARPGDAEQRFGVSLGHVVTFLSTSRQQSMLAPTIVGEPDNLTPSSRLASEGSGVRGPVHLPEMVGRHQGVDLCRRHRGMPQEFLHHSDIGPAVEQVGGVGMTQAVR